MKKCVEGVQRAVEEEDWKTAAEHIGRYRELAAGWGEGWESGGMPGQAAVTELTQRVVQSVSGDLAEAMRAGNEDEIVRLCLLYIPLGAPEEAMARYADYLRSVCAHQADALYKQLLRSLGQAHGAQKEEPLTCVDAMTRMFEDVAALLHTRTQMIEEHFGTQALLELLLKIQKQTGNVVEVTLS